MAEDGKRKRLGRGLDALFSESSDETLDGNVANPVQNPSYRPVGRSNLLPSIASSRDGISHAGTLILVS